MTVERATRNVGWVFGLYLVRRLIRLGYLASFARLLQTRGFGDYYFLLTLIAMCSTLSAVGLKVLLIRRVNRSRDEAAHFINRCFGFNLVSSMLFAAAVMIAAPFTHYGPDVRLGMIIMGLTVVPLSLVALMHSTSVAHEKLWVYAMLDNVTPLVEAAIGLTLLFNGFGLVALCVLHLALYSLYAVVFFVMMRRHIVRVRFVFDVRAWLGYLRESWKIAASALQSVLYRQFGIILLSVMSGNEKVGYFGGAMVLIEVLGAASNAFRSAVFPYMVRAWERSPDELKGFQESCVRLLAAVAVPVGLLGMFLARPMLPLVFGARFEASVPVFQILIWMLFPLFMEPILAQVCYAAGRLYLPLVGHGTMNAVRIGLSVGFLLWFKEHPAQGLAWAMLLSAFLGFVIYTLLIRRYIYSFNLLGPLAWTAAASAAPVALVVLLTDRLSAFALAPLAVVLFVAGVLAFGVLTAREYEIIKRALFSFRSPKTTADGAAVLENGQPDP